MSAGYRFHRSGCSNLVVTSAVCIFFLILTTTLSGIPLSIHPYLSTGYSIFLFERHMKYFHIPKHTRAMRYQI